MMFMDELPSAEFRRQYAKLTKPTIVTVNGHPIGVWLPGAGAVVEQIGRQMAEGVKRNAPSAQAARDDLLRKINRGK